MKWGGNGNAVTQQISELRRRVRRRAREKKSKADFLGWRVWEAEFTMLLKWSFFCIFFQRKHTHTPWISGLGDRMGHHKIWLCILFHGDTQISSFCNAPVQPYPETLIPFGNCVCVRFLHYPKEIRRSTKQTAMIEGPRKKVTSLGLVLARA